MRYIRKNGVIVKNLSRQERLPLTKKAYCEEGKTQKQIAEELMVAEATISKDLSYLRSIGEIDEDAIQKRKNRVKELYQLGKPTKEMAEIIGVSTMTILRILEDLKSNHEISEIPIPILERWKKVKERYYDQEKEVSEIAKELNISITTVKNDLKHMKEHGLVTRVMEEKRKEIENIEKTRIEERRVQVDELYFKQGKRIKEITKKLGVFSEVIRNDIRILREQKNQERRIQVKNLYFNQGKTVEEIAEILEVLSEMVKEDIKCLRAQKIQERRKKVSLLYSREPKKEIAKQLGVSLSTVTKDIRSLKEQGIIVISKKEEQKKKIEKRREKVEKMKYIQRKQNKEIAEKLEISIAVVQNDIGSIKKQRREQPKKYINNYRVRFKNNKIKPHEMENIKELIDQTKDYPDIIFYTRLCVHFNEFVEAIQFIDRQVVVDANFTEEERKSFEELRRQIETIHQKLIQRKIAELGESELQKAEIIEMRKNLEEKEQESRKLEENDEEEQQIS